MANLKEVYDVAMSGYSAALIEEQANFQKAELTGDFSEQVRASQAMAQLRAAASEYHNMANEHAASQRPTVQANKFGLSEREIEHAKIAGCSEEEYSKNKARLAALRARGEYATQSQERDG